jgi:hypothetical protein
VSSYLRSPLIRAALLAFGIAAAHPALGANAVIPVQAKAVKPLSLSSIQDLNLGTIALGPGAWGSATVGISRTGQFTCTNANLTCSGATQVASYSVSGSNNETIRITAPNVTLTNQNDPTRTLTLVVDSPATVTLPNAGNKGTVFSLGGSIALSSTTAGGLYTGTFNVTVDY